VTQSRAAGLFFVFSLALMFAFPGQSIPAGGGEQLTHRTDEISGGAAMSKLAIEGPVAPDVTRDTGPYDPLAFVGGISFTGYDFNTNPTLNGGFYFIPPDPIGAAGPDRLIAVVNVGIECKTKTGVLVFIDDLHDFFSALGDSTLGTFTFDPKVVYDHYEDRFVVVTLERTSVASGGASDASRILIAVSKTSTPATATSADWWYHAIDSKITIGTPPRPHWVDYPGFEVDEEAVYITGNMFPFTSGSGGVRLWIVDKGTTSGFYAGGAASVNVHDPIVGGAFALTTQPALVFGAGGAGTGIGTYLVGYSSLTTGGPGGQEAVQVIRVDDPLGLSGGPVFTDEFVFAGDLEDVGGVFGFPSLPDAPQLNEATGIEVNDSRALDAVWRDDALWLTTTINPNAANDPTNAGQTTAHWFKLDTSAVTSSASPAGLITMDQQGNIGGEDIAAATYTFFPALAVNSLGEAKFGFSASAATIYCGAYVAGRVALDPAGTVGASLAIQVGVRQYRREFPPSTRNRWGDYSGMAVDPADERVFWAFNEYAWFTGTPGVGTGTGRWKTVWGSCATSCVSVTCPADTALVKTVTASLDLCIVNCGGVSESYSYVITDDAGWCVGASSATVVAPGDTTCISVDCTIPVDTCAPDSTVLRFVVTSSGGEVDSCSTVIQVANQPPVAVCQNVEVQGTTTEPCTVAVAAAEVDDGSLDPDGDSITLTLDPPGPYANGVHNVDLIVTDLCGEADTCQATITVTCPLGPILEVDPVNVIFGTVANTDTVCATIKAKNVGDQDLTIASVTGCDTNGFYTDQSGLTLLLTPGDSTSFDICFSPEHSGADTCTTTVASDGGTEMVMALVGGTTGIGDVGGSALVLGPILPNPFNLSARIRFVLPEESPVRIAVFDSQGRRVRTLLAGELRPPGTHEVVWNGRDDHGVATGSGVYFVKLTTRAETRVTRAVRIH
jgi:hypothetical protein